MTTMMMNNTPPPPPPPCFDDNDINDNDVSTESSLPGDNNNGSGSPAPAASSCHFNFSNKTMLVFFPIASFGLAILGGIVFGTVGHLSSSNNVNVRSLVGSSGESQQDVTRALRIRKKGNVTRGTSKSQHNATHGTSKSKHNATLFTRALRIGAVGDLDDDEEDWIEDVTETVCDVGVGRAFAFEVKGVSVDSDRECDMPEHEQREFDKAASWDYFDELIEKNRETASLARSVEEHAPKREFGNLNLKLKLKLKQHESHEVEEGGGDDNLELEASTSIPHRLIFTHKDNLLDCDVSSSVNSEPSLHTLAHNVRDTIKSYKEVWGDDVQVTFLTDEECRRALYETEPELLTYYDDLQGMFKGDLCRSAELFLNGGYYFDVDLLVVHPFVASPSNKFVTVKWPWYEDDPQFFQAFIAATPRNEIIKKSLTIMLEILNGKRAARGGAHLIGTQGMQDAWAEAAQEDPSIAFHGKDKEVYLLSEYRIGEKQGCNYQLPTQMKYLKPGFSDGTCNYFVADDTEKSVYFFSHILGTRYCGQPEAEAEAEAN